MLTNSTLENWCSLIKPLVCLPALPASDLKQYVAAVYLTGNSPSIFFSAAKFTKGTPDVGISLLPVSITKDASLNLGN
jgi:hypothetical protein